MIQKVFAFGEGERLRAVYFCREKRRLMVRDNPSNTTMKITILSLFCIAALLLTAGCISPAEAPEDPLLGTWVTMNYTNSAGTYYTKIYDTFYPDHVGTEKGYVEDGSTTNWDFMWIKNTSEENAYVVYYSPISFLLAKDGMSGVTDSAEESVNGWKFNRTAGTPNSFAGNWETDEMYLFNEQMFYLQANATADGEGTVRFHNDAGEMTIQLTWVGVGEGMYVLSFSHETGLKIHEDGQMYDDFGYLYTKV